MSYPHPRRRSRFAPLGFALAAVVAVAAGMNALHAGATAEADARAEAPAAAPADDVAKARLVVRIADLRNHDGQLIFGVFRAARGFPSDAARSVNWQVRAARGDSGRFEVELPPGEYAASILHDENANNKMDQNLIGVPTEGYGVTNNPKPRFRAAKFKEALFTLPPSGAEVTISVQYF